MAKPTAQQCHALTTYFVNKVKEASGESPVVNRNKARWGFEALLMDYTPDKSRKIIDYYIEHWDSPSLDWFMFNYDKVVMALEESIKVEAQRLARRKATQERLEQWRNRWQN